MHKGLIIVAIGLSLILIARTGQILADHCHIEEGKKILLVCYFIEGSKDG